MPFLGTGIGQNISTAPQATWVFTPTPGHASTVRFYNPGGNIAYIGQAGVTWQTGFPIPPNCKPIELQNVTTTLYAVSNVVPGAATNTVSTAAVAGVTAFTVSAVTGIVAGGAVVIGNGPNREAFTVLGTTATSVTVSTASIYAHPTGDTATTASVYSTPLQISAGAFA
jgi:hypothetical protein